MLCLKNSILPSQRCSSVLLRDFPQQWLVFSYLGPPVGCFTDRIKAILLLWIFYLFSVLCLLCLCACLPICAMWSPAGKGLSYRLSFVVSNREFVTFALVSWVRCGI